MSTSLQTQPALTRDQIEAAITTLAPVNRVMLRLLLLRYVNPLPEDVFLMATERTEPNKRAGGDASKVTGGGVPAPQKVKGTPRSWVIAIEGKVSQFATVLREERQRLEIQVRFLQDYGEGLRQELEAIEGLLRTDFEASPETLEDLRTQARLAPVAYSLKKLMARADKQEIEEEEYLRERLFLEYQAHARRFERARRRLNQLFLVREAMITSSLSDEFLATVWGISKDPITNRRVKSVQQYINALVTAAKGPHDEQAWTSAVTAGIGRKLAGGSNNEGMGSRAVATPGDLWSLTLHTLAAEPMETLIPKPCQHHLGGKILAGKFRSLATYLLGEEDDIKVWDLTAQCLHCLTMMRTLQQEADMIGQSPDAVLSRIKTRTAMPRKEVPEAAARKTSEPEEAHSEHVALILRDFTGEDAGQAGAKTWW